MRQTTDSDSSLPAKRRILDAAVRLFSCRSYDAITWRDIATEARVDVAYVHRSFGAKSELLRAVLTEVVAAAGFDETIAGSAEGLPGRLARQFVMRSSDSREASRIGAFEIVLHSSTSTEARAVVQDFVEAGLLQSLPQKLGHGEDRSRAALIMSLLAGFDLMYWVIGARTMAALDKEWLAQAVECLIRHAAEVPAPAAAHEKAAEQDDECRPATAGQDH